MDWNKVLFTRLVIAVPEILWQEEVLRYAIRLGYISRPEIAEIKYWIRQTRRVHNTFVAQSGLQILQRLAVISPELIGVPTIDLLRRLNVIDENQGHLMRLFSRSLLATGIVPGRIASNATINDRYRNLLGVVFSESTVDLLRRVPIFGNDVLDLRTANGLRAFLIAGERSPKILRKLREGEGLMDTIFLVFPELMDEDFVRIGVLTGAITPDRADLLRSILNLGRRTWTVGGAVFNHRGFEQRALLVSSGMMSPELMVFLRRVGLVPETLGFGMDFALQVARLGTRARLDYLNRFSRRYRVVPGESPIATFARTSRDTDQDILSLLSRAARRTQKELKAEASKQGFGNRVRNDQRRILVGSLFTEMRALWEGVGYLTILGEREAGRAAIDSMDYVGRSVWGKAGGDADAARRALREAGRAGVDSYISREENLVALSRRVYKNTQLFTGRVNREIQIALIQGKSASEMARIFSNLFDPKVHGGVSHAAMRLARTEINNAFHITGIRFTREMPWVLGYKWHLSNSHPKADKCDEYANEDHDRIGSGVFKKRNVPQKPHPHCFCYITPVTMSDAQFAKAYRRGSFTKYLRAVERSSAVQATG